jgi:hypothetical protein
MKSIPCISFLLFCSYWSCDSNEVIKEWKMIDNQWSGSLTRTHDEKYHLKFQANLQQSCAETEIQNEDQLLFVSESSFTRENMFKHHLGPDDIFIDIAGKTFQTLVPRYLSCNTYYTSFVIETSGVYHISIQRLHQNFTAVSERQYTYMNYETLLQEWIELKGSNLTTTTVSHNHHHNENCTYGSNQGVWKAKPNNIDLMNGLFDSLEKAKAAPINFHGVEYKNLTMPYYVHMTYPYVNNKYKNCVDPVDQYSWSSESCGFPHIAREEANKLLENKFIIFSGDSQMRTFAINFFAFVCGIQLPFTYAMASPPNFYVPPGHRYCQTTGFQYINNAYCKMKDMEQLTPSTFLDGPHNQRRRRLPIQHHSDLRGGQPPPHDIRSSVIGARGAVPHHFHEMPNRSGKVDLLIANCGQHPASLPFVQNYTDLLRTFRDGVIGRGFNAKNFYWMETVALPLRQDEVVVGDERTIQRMQFFNTIANKMMHAKQIPIISYFFPMLPFVNKICDLAHYVVAGSNDPGIQKVLRIFKYPSPDSSSSSNNNSPSP